jgi:TM2 domain-containing membrane protein YozV
MFCSACGANNDPAARFCHVCGKPIAASTATAPPPADSGNMRGAAQPQPGQPPVVTGKSPVVAAILSLLIVGLGQFYNGDGKKGVTMLGAAIVLGAFSLGVLWFGIGIWSAVDAYQVASGTGKRW